MDFLTLPGREVYGAFSISLADVARVSAYIANQAEHHRHKTFQEKYKALLSEFGIEHDARYPWG